MGRYLPEDGEVRGFHQHLHQRVHHLGVEDDGVEHLAQFAMVSEAQRGLGHTGVGLWKHASLATSPLTELTPPSQLYTVNSRENFEKQNKKQ